MAHETIFQMYSAGFYMCYMCIYVYMFCISPHINVLLCVIFYVYLILYIYHNNGLVGGLNPSEKYNFVSWAYDIPN